MMKKYLILIPLLCLVSTALAQYDWINRRLPVVPAQDTTGIRWMKEYSLSTTVMGKRYLEKTTYYNRHGHTITPLTRNAYDSLGRLTDRVEYTTEWIDSQRPDTLISSVYKIGYDPSGLIVHAGLLEYSNYGKATIPDTTMWVHYLMDTIYVPEERKFQCRYLDSYTQTRAHVWGEIPTTRHDTLVFTRIFNDKGKVIHEELKSGYRAIQNMINYTIDYTYDRWGRLEEKVTMQQGYKDSVVYQYNSQHYPIGYNGLSWNEEKNGLTWSGCDSAQVNMRCLPNGTPQQITQICYSQQYDELAQEWMDVQYTYRTYFDKRGNKTRWEIPEQAPMEFDYKYWDE